MMQIAQRKTQSAPREERLRFALQMAEQAKRVGERIEEERTKRDWSRPELARRLPGVTSGNDVYRWEKGKHVPRSDMLEAIAALFEIDLADLYGGSQKAQPLRKPEGGLLDKLSAQAADGQVAQEVAALREQVNGVAAELEAMTGLLQKLAKDLKSVQGDLATLKRRKAV